MRSALLKSYQLWCLNLALKNCRIIWLLHNIHWIWSFWNCPIICTPNFVIDDALSACLSKSFLFHIFSFWDEHICQRNHDSYWKVWWDRFSQFAEISFIFSSVIFAKKGHSEFVQLVEYIIIILVRCSAFTWRLLSKRQILAYVVNKTRAGQ